MRDAFIYDWKRREQEQRDQGYDNSRPHAEIGIPDGSLIDDRKERYERWRKNQTPKPNYDPTINLEIDFNIAPAEQKTVHTLEGCL